MNDIARVAAKVIATEPARRPPMVERWWLRARTIEGIRVVEQTIRHAEMRLDCSLPEPYRTWLKDVGYGIGPFNGLLPIESPHATPTMISSTEWGTRIVPPIFDLGVEDAANGVGELSDIASVPPEFIALINASGRAFFSLKSARGIVAINEGDNGSYYGLVVVGPLRGMIVSWLYDNHVFGEPPEGKDFGAVLFVPGKPQGFLSWLDKLVDEETEWRRRMVPR
jgi:hypothetical protein